MTAALGAASGALHAGASVEVRSMLSDTLTMGGPGAVGTRLRRSARLPGFGMPLYPGGDPRAVAMLATVATLPGSAERHAAVRSVLDAVAGREVPPPNCDFGLAALTFVLDLPVEAGEALFVIGRTAGWLAHAAEEYAARTSFRVRAAYTGVRPT